MSHSCGGPGRGGDGSQYGAVSTSKSASWLPRPVQGSVGGPLQERVRMPPGVTHIKHLLVYIRIWGLLLPCVGPAQGAACTCPEPLRPRLRHSNKRESTHSTVPVCLSRNITPQCSSLVLRSHETRGLVDTNQIACLNPYIRHCKDRVRFSKR